MSRSMKKTVLLFIALFVSCFVATSQVVVEVRLDSVQFWVGQQDGLDLTVSLSANDKLELPLIKAGDELLPNFEVVEVLRPDTSMLDDGKRMQIHQRYIVTAWDSSFYYLPPLPVKVNGKEHLSKQLAVKVYTLDVDTLHADQFYPPRGIMDNPFSWDDWTGVLWSLLGIILLSALIAWLWWHIKTGRPIFRLIRRKVKLPPHQVAMTSILKIKEERKWAEEDSKEYYTQLTDTLRTYIQDRYGFSALEMTSAEIIERLTEEGDQKKLDELREIFRTADLVKFAKWTTLLGENDANLVAAIAYVEETKQEPDENAKPEPEVIKETDKERLNQVIAYRVVIILAAISSVALLAFIVYRLWDLLS